MIALWLLVCLDSMDVPDIEFAVSSFCCQTQHARRRFLRFVSPYDFGDAKCLNELERRDAERNLVYFVRNIVI